jgi:hypothetical protein
MEPMVEEGLEDFRSEDRNRQYNGYVRLVGATEQPVDWAYEVWDEMVEALRTGDNHQRAIAAQVLANLAVSDPQGRMLEDFDALLAVTRDERFVTARHALQAIWKVGVAGEPQRQVLLSGLETRFQECATEKNCTLIRYDIIEDLRKLYDEVHDERVRETALALIETEPDPKYRKKYASLWRTR